MPALRDATFGDFDGQRSSAFGGFGGRGRDGGDSGGRGFICIYNMDHQQTVGGGRGGRGGFGGRDGGRRGGFDGGRGGGGMFCYILKFSKKKFFSF